MAALQSFMQRRGLSNQQVVLIGSGEQIFLFDTSSLAHVGETLTGLVHDEFPLKLYAATNTEMRAEPASSSRSPVSCPWSERVAGVE